MRLKLGQAICLLFIFSFGRTAIAQTDYQTDGPYKVVEEMEASLPNHTVYHPEDLGVVKGKIPVVAFGNGACANAGNAFENYLAEISSYGFLVVANGPINPAAPGRPPKPGEPFPPFPAAGGPGGTGGRGGRGPGLEQSKTSQLYETMDWAKIQNDDPASRFHNKLDLAAIAVSGQSCGGLQALEAGADPRVKTEVIFNSGIIRDPSSLPGGLPTTTAAAPGGAPSAVPPRPPLVLPGSVESLKKLHSPIIYIIGGETDIAYKNAESDFADINEVPLVNVNLTGVGHNGTLWQPYGGAFAKVASQWLLWQLKGDKQAGSMFLGQNCGLCSDPNWKIKTKNFK